MKVEIEITKKDLRSILCAAIRNYYGDLKSQLEPNNIYPWQPDKRDKDIINNLYDIHDACDAISDLCDMIEEVDTVDNDVNGKIVFDPTADENDEQIHSYAQRKYNKRRNRNESNERR